MFYRKLRDEYDKLEGALRKLGVDPDTIVGNHSGMSSGPDVEDYLEGGDLSDQVIEPADMLDPDLCTPFNVVAVPATNEHDDGLGGHDAIVTDVGLHSRTVGRLRHLDILEEVGCT